MPELSLFQYLIAFLCTIVFGISKAGIKGIGMIGFPLMAIAFGSKASTGIVLPLLMMGDVLAVWYYNRHSEWKYLRILLPWVLAGVLIGVWVGDAVPEKVFKYIMATIILVSVGLIYWWDRQREKQVPQSLWFGSSTGLVVGFTTMVGNLAGPFVNLFFLAMRVPKNNFIGTVATLFFIVNIFKLPFHIWVWETIDMDSFAINLILIPGILTGFFIGVWLVKIISENQFRQLILWLTGVGAVLLFFS